MPCKHLGIITPRTNFSVNVRRIGNSAMGEPHIHPICIPAQAFHLAYTCNTWIPTYTHAPMHVRACSHMKPRATRRATQYRCVQDDNAFIQVRPFTSSRKLHVSNGIVSHMDYWQTIVQWYRARLKHRQTAAILQENVEKRLHNSAILSTTSSSSTFCGVSYPQGA